jgi:hypothetical protein
MTPLWKGRVENNRILLDRKQDFHEYLQSLEGQAVELILRKPRMQRSLEANRYYWGVIVALLSEYTGHTAEEVHDGLKHRLLLDHTDPRFPRVRSTTELSVEEFAEYLERCKQLSAEFGLILPDPGQTV